MSAGVGPGYRKTMHARAGSAQPRLVSWSLRGSSRSSARLGCSPRCTRRSASRPARVAGAHRPKSLLGLPSVQQPQVPHQMVRPACHRVCPSPCGSCCAAVCSLLAPLPSLVPKQGVLRRSPMEKGVRAVFSQAVQKRWRPRRSREGPCLHGLGCLCAGCTRSRCCAGWGLGRSPYALVRTRAACCSQSWSQAVSRK